MPSIQIEQLLRITVAALIMLATIDLGIGERSAMLSIISLVMLSIAAYVTDITGMFRLRQSVANWAALGIVLVSAINASQIERHGQLLAVANLQSYLQYVLLFQPKTSRVYWQLAALSLGQVAIASTLVIGPMFGIMLLAYAFVGVITFALLLLHTESKRFEALAAEHAARPPAADSPSGRALTLVGHAATADPRDLGWALLRQAALVMVFTVSAAGVMFLMLPRWRIENREIASREPLRSIGFSRSVTLGELGEVVNNPDVVMRVKLSNVRGNESRPFRLVGEPLFRGTVVTRYEDHRWTQPRSNSPMQLAVEARSNYVRQQITAEPLDESVLCCIFPVFGVQPSPHLRINSRRDHVVRQEDYRDVQLEFELGTTGIVDDKQLTELPCEPRLGAWEIDSLLQMPGGTAGTRDPFPGLRAVAATVLRDKNIDPQNRRPAATELSNYLSASGQFFYSLEAQDRDRAVDPLEDFVTTHRSGHCEYFAGALVMMLRSQGIPARMAIGFKGGEWNSLGMYYQVQQLHAHTWVEAYLEPDEAGDREVEKAASGGRWLVLDPTEGAQESGMAAINAGLLGHMRQYLDYGRVLWTNYVLGLNAKRQQEYLYAPITEAATAAVQSVISPDAWAKRFDAVADSPVGVFWQWYRRHWFSWRGGLVAAGFCLVLLAVYGLAQLLLGALRRWGLVPSSRFHDDRPVLEMYRRLEAALARQGIERQAGQTAYEFAVAAGGEMAASVEHRPLASLPRRIVEMFYRVRFGGHTLDNVEADAVEHALVELELAPGRPRSNNHVRAAH